MDRLPGKLELPRFYERITKCRLLSRFTSTDRVIIWGHEFFPCPKELSDLIIWAMRKRFDLGETDAKERVYNGFYECRIRAKARLRVSSISRRFTNIPRPLFSSC